MGRRWAAFLGAAVIATAGVAATAQAKEKWDFELKEETGSQRLAAVGKDADKARETAALSTALCIEWVLQLIEKGKVDEKDLNDASDLKKLADAIEATFKKKRSLFADAFPEFGAGLDNLGLQIQVEGVGEQEWKSKTLSKAIKNLEQDQRYLLMAYEKGTGSGFWYVVGIDRGTGAKAVFDPFAGQLTEKKSGNVAKYLMERGKVAEKTGSKIEYFTVLKCSKYMDFGSISRLLKRAAKQAEKPYQDWCKQIFGKKGVSNYIHKDIPRFLPNYALSDRGKVVKKRFDKTTGKEFLLKLKEALGADVEVPDDGLFETDNRGKLQKFCEEKYKDGTEWETVLRMLCQQHGVLGIQEYQKAVTEAGLSDRPRPHSTSGNLAHRFKPEEAWRFDIDVTDKEVKVTQFLVLCEAPRFPVEFKVRLALENVLDRKSGKLKAEIAGVETTKGDFKD